METRSNQVLVGSIVLGLIAALVVFAIWLLGTLTMVRPGVRIRVERKPM